MENTRIYGTESSADRAHRFRQPSGMALRLLNSGAWLP